MLNKFIGLTIDFNDKGDICRLYKKYKPPRGKIFKELLRKYYLCMPSIVIRRSAIEGVPWFVETPIFLSMSKETAYGHSPT